MPVGFAAGILYCVGQMQMDGQHELEAIVGEAVLHLLPIGTSYSTNSPKRSPCIQPLFGYSAEHENILIPFRIVHKCS